MSKRYLFVALVFAGFGISLNAQKVIDNHETEPPHYIDLMSTQRLTQIDGVKQFNSESQLISALMSAVNGNGEIELQKFAETYSPVGDHISFEQYWQSRRIYRAQIKCNLTKNGEVMSWYHIPIDLIEVSSPSSTSLIAPTSISGLSATETEAIWFPSNTGGLMKAILKKYSDPSQHINMELILDETEQVVLYHQDLHSYAHSMNPVDTVIQVMVFDPDPLTTAGQTYGGLFTDQNDADIGALNNQRVSRTTKATYDNGMFYLENEYVSLEDFESPASTPPVQSSPIFDFTRSEQGFEYTNILYHLTLYNQYMQSLGFSLMDYQITVDPHAFFGQDNSYYSPGVGLAFGEGGVDDAEDADVIVHEYGHAISDDAAPGTNTGTERRTLDEANGDFLAASYSHSINSFNWEDVYTWDGHNTFWPGREVVTNKNYQNISFFGIYEHTDLWSACLMDIYFNNGRTVADKALLQALYSQAQNMSFSDMALDVLKADSLNYWGQHAIDMYNVFNNRGILNIPDIGLVATPEAGIEVLNSLGFSAGQQLSVKWNSLQKADYDLWDIHGRKAFSSSVEGDHFEISGEQLESGIYFLSVQLENGATKTIRLVRY